MGTYYIVYKCIQVHIYPLDEHTLGCCFKLRIYKCQLSQKSFPNYYLFDGFKLNSVFLYVLVCKAGK